MDGARRTPLAGKYVRTRGAISISRETICTCAVEMRRSVAFAGMEEERLKRREEMEAEVKVEVAPEKG